MYPRYTPAASIIIVYMSVYIYNILYYIYNIIYICEYVIPAIPMMIPPVPIPIPLRPRHPVLFGYRPKVRKKPPTALVASGVGRAVVFVRKKVDVTNNSCVFFMFYP